MFGIVLINKQDFNMYLQYNKQNNKEIDIEINEIYNQMSKNEQWIVDNFIDSDLDSDHWNSEYDLINCGGEHEWEYTYHYSHGGVLQLFNQCTQCGKKRSNTSLKHNTINNFKDKVARGEIKKFDVNLFNKYDPYTKYRSFFTIKSLKNTKIYNDEQQNNKIEREKKYADYLQSDKWKAIRLKVLKRDNNLCQGCLEATATDVHHITYANLGDELMFELLSLCRDCHFNRVHKDKQ